MVRPFGLMTDFISDYLCILLLLRFDRNSLSLLRYVPEATHEDRQ